MGVISIGVGYTWNGEVRADPRWKALRTFLTTVSKEARTRALSAQPGINFEEGASRADHSKTTNALPRIDVARLRATSGDFTWQSITARIRRSDVLLFDFTPANGGRLSANVWLELGFAQATHAPGSVYLVHAEETGHEQLPSDLRGLIVGHVPVDGRAADTSLRMALVSDLRERLLAGRGQSR
jgi:hypothetical protein